MRQRTSGISDEDLATQQIARRQRARSAPATFNVDAIDGTIVNTEDEVDGDSDEDDEDDDNGQCDQWVNPGTLMDR